jgi:hypothetical protein
VPGEQRRRRNIETCQLERRSERGEEEGEKDKKIGGRERKREHFL